MIEGKTSKPAPAKKTFSALFSGIGDQAEGYIFERRVLPHSLTTHTTLSTHIFRTTESSTQTAQFLASPEPKSGKMVEENRLLQQTGLKTLSTGYFLYLPGKVFHRLDFLEAMLRRAPFCGQYAALARALA